MSRALIVWGNWGPYHHARFRAFRDLAGRHGRVVEGLELFPRSGIYDWDSRADAPGLHRLDLGSDEMAFRPGLLVSRAAPLLLRLEPEVVFVPSYWHWSLFLNVVSRLAGARIVMMNESHAGTERARGLKKRLKRWIVASFHAGLVGGAPHRRFFASLGLAEDRLFPGYDAVDNAHFEAGARAARERAAEHRARLGLPERYFLSLGRFVEKKNLPLLVEACAGLAPAPGGRPPDLVFVGSGEREPEVRAMAARLGLAVLDHPAGREREAAAPGDRPAVHFYGFRQVEENPVFYALATAFVLPSLREEWGLVVNEAMACGLPVLVSRAAGCAEDLVVPGENGETFDPADAGALRRGLQALADDPARAARMGEASRRRIAAWGCERFAAGALRAWEAALRP